MGKIHIIIRQTAGLVPRPTSADTPAESLIKVSASSVHLPRFPPFLAAAAPQSTIHVPPFRQLVYLSSLRTAHLFDSSEIASAYAIYARASRSTTRQHHARKRVCVGLLLLARAASNGVWYVRVCNVAGMNKTNSRIGLSRKCMEIKFIF